VTLDGHILAWSGPLPMGATVIVSYSVTVSPEASAGAELHNTVVSTDPASECNQVSTDDARCSTVTTILSPLLTNFAPRPARLAIADAGPAPIVDTDLAVTG
jgi:hypothetical protein